MIVSAELSLYPLTKDFEPPIDAFIERLEEHLEVRVVRHLSSTLVIGEHDVVMDLIKQASRETFHRDHASSLVIKLVNVDVSQYE